MRGHNRVWLSGNVGGKIVKSTTSDGNPACSFMLASNQVGREATWVRINCFGELVTKIQDKLKKGAYFSVEGELMNRQGKYGELTEVRAKDIVFIIPGKEETESTENSSEPQLLTEKSDGDVWT